MDGEWLDKRVEVLRLSISAESFLRGSMALRVHALLPFIQYCEVNLQYLEKVMMSVAPFDNTKDQREPT